jgi:hypothetical protein
MMYWMMRDARDVQGEAAMSPDTLGMPGAQRSVAFCVHSWVQVTPLHPAPRRCHNVVLALWCISDPLDSTGTALAGSTPCNAASWPTF